MKISFTEREPQKNLDQISQLLEGRKLADLVSFQLRGKDLEVVIKKMGTSTLRFAHSESSTGMLWELRDEKIALTHRAFKDEMLEKIIKLVNQAGGEVDL